MPEKVRLIFRASSGWQGPETRSWERVKMPGTRSMHAVLAAISREVRQLAMEAIIETGHQERHFRADRTGLLASAPLPTHPGVVLYVENRRLGAMRYACDAYSHWLDNLSAVAKTLEALRGIDRWGVAKGGEQYTGWKQLPPAPAPEAPDPDPRRRAALVLLARSGHEMNDHNVVLILINPEKAKEAYQKAVHGTHPDRHPDMDGSELREVLAAWEVLKP